MSTGWENSYFHLVPVVNQGFVIQWEIFAHAFIQNKTWTETQNQKSWNSGFLHLLSPDLLSSSFYVIITYSTQYNLNWKKKELCADK